MKRLVTTTIAAATLVLPLEVLADDPASPPPLKLRAKLAEVASAPSAFTRAPFVPAPGEPHMDLMPAKEDTRLNASKSSCSDPGRSLCYDPGTNKIVYKKTRDYMPELPGMRAEHISLRRDRITFKYTFQ